MPVPDFVSSSFVMETFTSPPVSVSFVVEMFTPPPDMFTPPPDMPMRVPPPRLVIVEDAAKLKLSSSRLGRPCSSVRSFTQADAFWALAMMYGVWPVLVMGWSWGGGRG